VSEGGRVCGMKERSKEREEKKFELLRIAYRLVRATELVTNPTEAVHYGKVVRIAALLLCECLKCIHLSLCNSVAKIVQHSFLLTNHSRSVARFGQPVPHSVKCLHTGRPRSDRLSVSRMLVAV
jgi:hypothetical protein